jgi:hypothetical protein
LCLLTISTGEAGGRIAMNWCSVSALDPERTPRLLESDHRSSLYSPSAAANPTTQRNWKPEGQMVTAASAS